MFKIKEVILEEEQQTLISFLSKNNLEYEYDIDFSILVYDDDQLIATGSLANNIMKCFLVIEKYKGVTTLEKIPERIYYEDVEPDWNTFYNFMENIKRSNCASGNGYVPSCSIGF